jgi:phenylacetate-coenzyme A ligase PaaK-like adenylate-forming protein
VDGILATQREFGAIGPDAAELLSGPELDENSRREIQLRRFRTQARRAAAETEYYGPIFERLGLDLKQLKYEDIARIPITSKEAVRSDPDAFVRRSSAPAFRTTTTGTTGRPTGAYFSAREMQATALLNAIAFLQAGLVGPEDIVQISTSSRATLGNTCFSLACQRIGAVWYQTGLVDPAHALAMLSEPRRLPGKKARPSYLNTYASYLGELVEHGLAAGRRPADFGLQRISVGGEIVTAGLKRRCQELFGPVEFVQGYAMTETWPFGATRCAHGHLHFEPSQGLLEVLDPDTLEPAAPGAAGVIVATPFPPYRDAGILLRYNTEDVAQALADPPGCSLRSWPAAGDLLGKLRLSVRTPGGWVHARQVLEAVEDLDEIPLPARCGFRAAPGGAAVEVSVRRAGEALRRKLGDRLEAQGVPLVDLRLVEDPALLENPLPRRCDLREAVFEARVYHEPEQGMRQW